MTRTEKVSQSIAREIVHTIIDQRLEPGSVLPSETEMLEQFQVGRASLREALRLLEVQGLVAMKPGPGGGPIVGSADYSHFGRMATLFFQLSGATFGDLLEARRALEPMMVHSIAEERDPTTMAMLADMLETDHVDDDQAYLALVVGFHSLVASSARNPVLNLLSSAISHIYADRVPGTTFPRERRNQVVEEHRAILRAMVQGQPARAEDLMRLHMDRTNLDVRSRYPGLLDEIVDWR